MTDDLDEAIRLRAEGNTAKALESVKRTLVTAPADFSGLQLIGVMHCEVEDFANGLPYLYWASCAESDNPHLWLNIALGHRRLGQHSLALSIAQRSLLLSPDNAVMYLAVVRYVASRDIEIGLMAKSLRICSWAIAIGPDLFEVAFHFGSVWKWLGNPDVASGYYERAVALSPDAVVPLIALADVLAESARFSSSQIIYERACRLQPDNHDALYHLSLVQLRKGDFENGWVNYDHRWLAAVGASHLKSARTLRSLRPEYKGVGSGKCVLLWAEQGVGDEIMFGRLIGEFLPRCRQVLVQIDSRLIGLFSRAFPSVQFFALEQDVPIDLYDEQLPLGSLGRILRSKAQSFIGNGGGFLAALPELASKVRRDINVDRREFLVGLCWRAANPENRRVRSIPLEAIMAALGDERLRFLNLQYGNVDAEINLLKPERRQRLLRHPNIDLTKELEGVAGVIASCDLVISVGNTVAHLAGALNKKCWVLLPHVAGWRWLHGHQRCAWYDSVRLFRQDARGHWNSVLAAVNDELQQELSARRQP